MNYKFPKNLIQEISPILKYLQSQGINNKLIEQLTNNPNTKYYLSRIKDTQDISQIPDEALKAAGIHIDSHIVSKPKLAIQYKDKIISFTSPDLELIQKYL